MRCLVGDCATPGAVSRRELIGASSISSWRYAPSAPADGSERSMVQLTGDVSCPGDAILTVGGDMNSDAAHLVARVDWGQGAAGWTAWIDVTPGQAIDILGASSLTASVGWVGTPAAPRWAYVAATGRGRTTDKATLSTPLLAAADGAAGLWVPPFAREVEILSADGAAVDVTLNAGNTVIGDWTAITGKVPVAGGANLLTVSGPANFVARWSLCL